MTVDVTRHEPNDDPPWIEAEYEGARYEYQIVGENRLQLTATGEGGRVENEPPREVVERLESMGYAVERGARGPGSDGR